MAFTTATAINDAGTYPVTTVSPRPDAGEFYTDPVFGTRIMRATDAATGDGASVPYSYWPPWNLDSTRFWLPVTPTGGGTNVKTLWDFDPVTGAMSNQRALQVGGDPLHPEGLIWSRVSANLLYGFTVGWTSLYTLVPGAAAVEAYALRTRIQAVLPTAHSMWQMSMGGADRYFCWSVRDNTYQDIGIAVYDVDLDTLVVRDLTGITAYDEAHLTRDGALVVISSNPGPALLWDWVAHPTAPYSEKSFAQVVAHIDFGPSTQMAASYEPDGSGHYSVYDLAAFNAGSTLAASQRHIANIKDPTAVADWPSGHWTWQSFADPDPLMVYLTQEVSTDQTAAWRPYFDEVWKVWTASGSTPQFRRLCHHRSQAWAATNYYASVPRGSVDSTGRWLAWTSDWQVADTVSGNTRTDVYILQIPTEAEFAAGDYADAEAVVIAAAPSPAIIRPGLRRY